MKAALGALGVLIAAVAPAVCQVDTSSYPRAYQPPSMFDTIGKIQQIEIQRQQIEMQRLQLEQQRLQMERSDPELQRQLKFEREQAELYQRRQIVMQRLQLQERQLQIRQAEEFDRRQAEVDQRNQLRRAKTKKASPINSN